jgi:DNA-binding response OmpR family regulator
LEYKQYTILFVEDNDVVRNNYVQALQTLFKAVYEASDGEKAYRVYKEKAPDIIISDVNMPKVGGVAFVKKVRKNDNDTKIILLTAFYNKELLLEVVSLKLINYLVKPVSVKSLMEALDNAINEINYDQEILFLKNDYSWNYHTQTLFYDREVVKLTNKEQQVLSYIFSNIHGISTYYLIQEEVWEEADTRVLSRLKTVIKNIRHKTFEDIVINNHGIGYSVERR